ncbi:hypothetical protein STEG23_037268 [Scotinomys teguina]
MLRGLPGNPTSSLHGGLASSPSLLALDSSSSFPCPAFLVIAKSFQKSTNNKKQFLKLTASGNSSQKVLKTEIQGINAMQVAVALRSTSLLLKVLLVILYPSVVFDAAED